MSIDERGCFASKSVRCVIEFLDLVRAAKDSTCSEVTVCAAEKTEEFFEAAFLRVQRRLAPKVPLADKAGNVAGGFEAIGDGGFRQRQSLRLQLD